MELVPVDSCAADTAQSKESAGQKRLRAEQQKQSNSDVVSTTADATVSNKRVRRDAASRAEISSTVQTDNNNSSSSSSMRTDTNNNSSNSSSSESSLSAAAAHAPSGTCATLVSVIICREVCTIKAHDCICASCERRDNILMPMYSYVSH